MAPSNQKLNRVRRVRLKFALAAYKVIHDNGLATEFERRVTGTKARLGSVIRHATRLGLDTSSISTASVLPQTASRSLKTMIDRGYAEALQDQDKVKISVDPEWVTQFVALIRETGLKDTNEFTSYAVDNCDRPNPYDCPDQ